MNDTKLNPNSGSDQDGADIDTQVAELLKETKDITQEIKEANNLIEKDLEEVSLEADVVGKSIGDIVEDLKHVDKEAEDELDALIIKQSEDLASEE